MLKILIITAENKTKLLAYKNNIKFIETNAFIGKNGLTHNKIEGDGKTPKGLFPLGITFGMHERKNIVLPSDINYIQINDNLYWIDDVNSIYYNNLVDITKVKKDWNSAEHLIDFPMQYEYAIEIKSNKDNFPGKRKCNFFTL